MMNCNPGLLICIGLSGAVILLYFFDPNTFFSKLMIHTFRIKFFIRTHFGKSGKDYKEKYRKLNTTIQFCQESISKYVNRKNLSTLQDDDILQELLSIYRELLDVQLLPENEVKLEKINEIFSKIIDTYSPDMDPYYDIDFDDGTESA